MRQCQARPEHYYTNSVPEVRLKISHVHGHYYTKTHAESVDEVRLKISHVHGHYYTKSVPEVRLKISHVHGHYYTKTVPEVRLFLKRTGKERHEKKRINKQGS